MSKNPIYKTVIERCGQLDNAVNKMIERGYLPCGSITIKDDKYIQPMMWYPTKENLESTDC